MQGHSRGRTHEHQLRVVDALALDCRWFKYDEAAGVPRVGQARRVKAAAVAVEHEHPGHATERRARLEDPIEVEQVRVQLHLDT